MNDTMTEPTDTSALAPEDFDTDDPELMQVIINHCSHALSERITYLETELATVHHFVDWIIATYENAELMDFTTLHERALHIRKTRTEPEPSS